jgi:putative SOS response-associated peptidase YedK
LFNSLLENVEDLKSLLRPAKKGTLEHYPVSKDVGKVSNNGDHLLELNSE